MSPQIGEVFIGILYPSPALSTLPQGKVEEGLCIIPGGLRL